MLMELKNIVMHEVIKEKSESPKLELVERLLPIKEETNGFIKALIKNYFSTKPTYGAFDEKDTVNYPFQTHVKNYFTNNNFLKFSQEAMKTMEKAYKDTRNAKGGYVVFAHYIEMSENFIIILMLDNIENYTANNELDINKILTLDIQN